MTAKIMLMVVIRQRPASSARTWRSTSSFEVAENRSDTTWPAPIVFVSRMPLTVRPCSTCDNMSARWRCWREVTSRRSRATRRVSQMAGGSTIRDSRESRQLSAAIATAVAATVVTLVAIDVAVVVTTDCMPLMSLVRRDWTSPPLVRVKKASDWRWRCEKTSVRRACMTRCPTRVETQVCSTPKIEVAAVTATIPPTSKASRCRLRVGSASSIAMRVRNGVASPTSEETTRRVITARTCQRYGAKRAVTRRQDTGDSAS